MVAPFARARSRKSSTVTWWMFWVSYQLTGSARAMQENSFQTFEAFTAATTLYLVLNLLIVFAMRAVERKAAVPGYGLRKES